MSISDVLSDAISTIMQQYLYDKRGQPRDLYDAECIQAELLPVLTAMNTAARRLSTPPSIPIAQVRPLHCEYCDMDFPDALQIQHHAIFDRHTVGDVLAALRGDIQTDQEGDPGPVF